MQNALASPVLSEALTYFTNGKVVSHDVEDPSTSRTSAPLFSLLLPKPARGWIAAIEQLLVEIRNDAGEVAA